MPTSSTRELFEAQSGQIIVDDAGAFLQQKAKKQRHDDRRNDKGDEIGCAQDCFEPAPLDAVDPDGCEHAQADVETGRGNGKSAVFFSVVKNNLSLKSSTKFSVPTYSGSEKKSQSKKDMLSPDIVGTRKKSRKLNSVGRMKR